MSLKTSLNKKKAENELKDKIKILKTISSVNKYLFFAKDKQEMLEKICKEIQNNYYKLVWIGLCDENTKRVIPVAQAGFEKDYLNSIIIKYDNSKYGNGPTGTAIKTKKPSIIESISSNKKYTP